MVVGQFEILPRAAQTINVAKSDSQEYTSIKDALVYAATVAKVENQVAVNVYPGEYSEINPITIPAYTTLLFVEGHTNTTILPTVADEHCFVMASNSSVCQTKVSGTLDATHAAIYIPPASSNVDIHEIIVCDVGIGVWNLCGFSGGGVHVHYISASGTVGTVFKNGAGSITDIGDIWANGLGTYNTIVESSGAASIVTLGQLRTYIFGAGSSTNGLLATTGGVINAWSCAIGGNVINGVYAQAGSNIRMSAASVTTCTNGLRVAGDGQIFASAASVVSNTTYDLYVEDPTGSIIFAGGAYSESKVSAEVGTIQSYHWDHTEQKMYIKGVAVVDSLQEVVLSNSQYASQANILDLAFEAHSERVLMGDDFNNVTFDFLKGFDKFASHSNLISNGEDVLLSSTPGVDVQIQDCDSVSGWDEYVFSGFFPAKGSFSADTGDFHEGTASLSLAASNLGNNNSYGIEYIYGSAQNWTAYENITFWNKITVPGIGHEAAIRLINSTGSIWDATSIIPENTWQQYSVSLAGCTFLDDVKSMIIYTTARSNSNDTYDCKFDDIRGAASLVYDASGTGTALAVPSGGSITEIFGWSKETSDYATTNIVWDVSLDGGNHWKSGFSLFNDGGVWIGTGVGEPLEKADGDVAWDNKETLQIRVTLSTTDTSMTPNIDDYFVMWKIAI